MRLEFSPASDRTRFSGRIALADKAEPPFFNAIAICRELALS
jgi:hypothetical protein